MVNDPARDRLVELARESGSSLSALSRLLGRNTTYLQQFVRKGSPRKLEETDRRTLARYFGVDESELRAPDLEENSHDGAIRGPFRRTGWVDVPRLAIGASAGPGTLADEDAMTGHLRFSERWLRELGLPPGDLAALTVAGDSMEPVLRDGDEILVAPVWDRLRDGIHVIRRDGALQVKRLQPGAPGRVAILSDNQAYPSDRDVPADEIDVLGRVVWKGGRI